MVSVDGYTKDGADAKFASKSVQDEVETGRLSEDGLNNTFTVSVNHDNNPDVARPVGAASVLWTGSVYPENALTQDVISVRGKGSPWNPGDESPFVWLRALSLARPDTAEVTLWPDLSGNGRSFLAGAAGTRPLYRATGLGALPGVAFDGVDDYLATDTFTEITGQPFTVYLVARMVKGTPPSSEALYSGSGGGSNLRLNYQRGTDNAWSAARGVATITTPVSVADTSVHIHKITYSGTTSNIEIDGVVQATGTLQQSGLVLSRLFLGSRPEGVLFAEMVVGELIIMQGTVSSGVDALIKNWLTQEWWL